MVTSHSHFQIGKKGLVGTERARPHPRPRVKEELRALTLPRREIALYIQTLALLYSCPHRARYFDNTNEVAASVLLRSRS